MLRQRKIYEIRKETTKKRVYLFILVYFVFLTAYLSVSTLSKYVGTAEGEGTVQIAKWSVSTRTNSENVMNIISGNTTDSYNIIVKSTSDVGCIYSVVVTNIPENVTLKLDGHNPDTHVGDEAIFNNVGSFEAGSNGTEVTHILLVSANINAVPVTENEIDIDVTFIQDSI